MEYRQVTKTEIDTLVHMRLLYLREDCSDASEQQFDTILANLPGYFTKHLDEDLFAFAAYENEKAVSVALLLIIEKPCNPRFITGKIGDVLNVYTLKEYRRQGISTRIMTMLMDFAKDHSLDLLELKATKDGYPLYRKLGFTENGTAYVPMKYTF